MLTEKLEETTSKYNVSDGKHLSLIKIEENLRQENEILHGQVKELTAKAKHCEDKYSGIEVKYKNLVEKQ